MSLARELHTERTRTANAVLGTILAHVESRHQAATLTRGDDVAVMWHALDAFAACVGMSLDVLDTLPSTDACRAVRAELYGAEMLTRRLGDGTRHTHDAWWDALAACVVRARADATVLAAEPVGGAS